MDWNKTFKFKKSLLWYSIFSLVVFVAITNPAWAEWQEPSSPPPSEDFFAPITTTAEPQAKEGYLLIDPVNYHPSDDSSLNFSINKPLVVYGAGMKFSTNTVYNDVLIVDEDTLYADAFLGYVSIGTKSRNANEIFNVVGQTVQIGTADDPINARALSSYSSDDYGIYTNAGNLSDSGFYGISTSALSQSIYGESLGNNVGVRGDSVDGVGIYARTDSSNYGAVYGNNDSSGFAGFFDGRVNVVSDLVADVFLPTGLQKSLIPYTSGQLVDSFPVPYAYEESYATDGNYFYFGGEAPTPAPDRFNFYKVSKTDGQVIKAWGRYITDTWSFIDMKFDGKYIIGLGNYGDIIRFDPSTETFIELSGSTTNLDGNNVPGDTSPMAVGTINGESYVWVPSYGDIHCPLAGCNSDDVIIRVKVSDLSLGNAAPFDVIDLNSTDVLPSYPGVINGLDFDGQYLWLAFMGANSGSIGKIWGDLDDPNGYANHPAIIINTYTSGLQCDARDVYFDGTYAWCQTNSGGDNERIVRIWADDPFDPKHPPISVGPQIEKFMGMTFDGTYLYAVGHHNFPDNGLYKILVADPSQYEVIDQAVQSNKVIFDGTYLWLFDKVTLTLRKYYSGTGMGDTNLGSVVQLDKVNGYCSVTTTQQCIYDWQCPTAETCNAGNTTQSGSTYISGNAEIKKDHCYASATHYYNRSCTPATVATDCSGLTAPTCVGGDIIVGDDVQVSNNRWGGICEDGVTYCTANSDCSVACYGGTVPVDSTSGTASCDEGDFMGGVELNANSEIINIYCWEL